MSYQKKTGCLSQGAHPGSYNDQDVYNDMLITVPERERERVWAVGNGQMHQIHLQKKVGSLNTMHDQIIILVDMLPED